MSSSFAEINVVADESVDAAITLALRNHSFTVYSVAENHPSITDEQVLTLANKHSALLITEDKDFGELVVRLRKKHQGILLIRLSGLTSEEKAGIVVKAIKNHFDEMRFAFSVIDFTKLRIKK